MPLPAQLPSPPPIPHPPTRTHRTQRRQLEYLHLRHFPFSKCGECQSSVCFHCGELAHPGLTCVESIERRTAACQVDNPRLLTLAWKFDNSKQVQKKRASNVWSRVCEAASLGKCLIHNQWHVMTLPTP